MDRKDITKIFLIIRNNIIKRYNHYFNNHYFSSTETRKFK